MTSQIENAQFFRSLHTPQSPLFLYNVWDAGSSKAVERAGAKAVATSSWSMAAAQGYEDGEQFPLEDMLAAVARIAKSVNVPVTVDFEGGYAANPETVRRNVHKLLEIGIVGFNFEDQIVDGPGLYSVEDQVCRIRAARHAADSMGVPAFINARTDVFLKADPATAHDGLMAEALIREKAYASAGADGFFVPGLTDDTLIRQVCDVATLPVNIMTTSTREFGKLVKSGVSRISLGPVPYIALMSALEKRSETAHVV
ncbi:2-methylisocitrate lyase-like PEP mutase family enzyme [Rhizobium skierniewicense]|uniref:2-methylisocitrate lyase-like PEP mutase family enzyme n=1 Tax=Rhizobium skierniewicense TaxID=984260 RepID=A0A7W6C8C2_9HYPH|nr:isocitrate lyase/phosphoenolpyruvate mutase family protein [Rhizobium skierniewicense]MBB3947545.1 2-methylisocitrate lyase-like PEP mutase family enzyme [Rhizobium skierniewicense]